MRAATLIVAVACLALGAHAYQACRSPKSEFVLLCLFVVRVGAPKARVSVCLMFDVMFVCECVQCSVV